jgi:membrane-bound lytic murein transglycosylase B
VPREILVSLLFVETRLGTFVGTENAFWSLACMAAADSPERMAGGLGDIPITAGHDAWLKAKLADKSEWAYKELRALLAFCVSQRLDPHVMPGSVYGAIGICQFMPSNLASCGEDGDGDGIINLFTEPDAIFSAAFYLTKHGWSAGQSVDRQRAALKRYNNLTIYANTILALAESIRTGTLQTGPPGGKQGSGKKNPKKK